MNGQGWAPTQSADNWLSMQNLHQDFISSFAVSPNSETSVTICDDSYQRKLSIFCVCICVCPSQTLSFLKSGSFWSYSLEEQMWHLCWLHLMKWQIIGAVPCVGSSLPSILCIVQILHDLFADGSSIKAFKKIVCWTNYWKHRMQLFPWISLKAWCWACQARCTGFSVRLPNQTNYPDSWDSIFDINKWLGQSPCFPALASFTLQPFFRKDSLQFKGQLHFRMTQASLPVPRLLKFHLFWKVFSALMICLIVEYFPKIPGGLFCFQAPVLWEQREPNTEFLYFQTLMCIFSPTYCLFPHLVLNVAFMFRLCSLNILCFWAR